MKKLMLLSALVLALAACATETRVVETRVVVVTATPVPPTATLVPPTATPLPPTAVIYTPTPSWDAKVDGFATNLRQLPDDSSQTVITLLGGAIVDVRDVTEDKEWVHVAYWEGGSATEGWLRVDELVLNVSLDDLQVGGETAFVPPPTRTPRPTELPLNERYIAHFVEKGFEVKEFPGEYEFLAGRVRLVVAVAEGDPMIGYWAPVEVNIEEGNLIVAHLQEASTFINPEDGWVAVSGALNSMAGGINEGFVHTAGGREVFFRRLFGGDNESLTIFTFLPEDFVHED